MKKRRDERTNLEKAMEAWPHPLPDWVRVLADECDQTSQGKVGTRIGYKGAAVVCAVLNKNYKGCIARVEDAIRGALMSVTVDCPVDGTITKDLCIRNQRQKLTTTSNRRIRLFRACPKCAHGKYGG